MRSSTRSPHQENTATNDERFSVSQPWYNGKDSVELVARFHSATKNMTTAQIVAATGLSGNGQASSRRRVSRYCRRKRRRGCWRSWNRARSRSRPPSSPRNGEDRARRKPPERCKSGHRRRVPRNRKNPQNPANRCALVMTLAASDSPKTMRPRSGKPLRGLDLPE